MCPLHCAPRPCVCQVNLTIQWDTQHDSPNQSTFCGVPYTQLTRRAYVTTRAAVRARFLPHWRCLLVALRKVGVGVRREARGPGHSRLVGGVDARWAPRLRARRDPGHEPVGTPTCRPLAPNLRPPFPKANTASEGADTVATAEAFSSLWQYFQVGGGGRGLRPRFAHGTAPAPAGALGSLSAGGEGGARRFREQAV
jgi:hypothetical protein